MTILQEIDAFLKRSGMSQSAFGNSVGQSSSFLPKWRRGDVRVGPKLQAKIRQWLDDNHDFKCPQPQARRFERSPTGVNVEINPDLWSEDAIIASDMLLAALRQHHPTRCAG
ncbi:hypothetical protein [uncultured Sphingobium sp.]|uniref:hypothetical protein n=1 Tax=uncultured Sphingobium sp. TaxID=316087 RepID=UPI00259B5792|nr:hypothetical protein [uncultured Sphingobium sp.]